MRDWHNVAIAVLLSTIVRFIFPLSNYVFDRNYWFIDGLSPYYLKADSYWYAKVLIDSGVHKSLIYFIPYLIVMLGLIIFYYLCRDIKISKAGSFIATMFLSLFPYYYNQTILGYVDTPPLILFFIIILIYIYRRIYLNIVKKDYVVAGCFILLFIFTLFVMNQIWYSNWELVGIMFIVSIIFQVCRTKLQYVGAFVVMLMMAMIKLDEIKGLYRFKLYGVSEYGIPLYVLYYVFAFVLLLLYRFNEKDSFQKFLFWGFMFNFTFSILIERVSAFAMIFGSLLIISIIDRLKYKRVEALGYIAVFIILNCMQIANDYYPVKPTMFSDYEMDLQHVDDEIINFWDNGYQILLITDATVMNRASPKARETTLFINGIMQEESVGITYLDMLNSTKNYTIILYSEDIYKALYLNSYMADNTDRNKGIMYKSMRNESLLYFDLVSRAEYDGKARWIYERRLQNEQ